MRKDGRHYPRSQDLDRFPEMSQTGAKKSATGDGIVQPLIGPESVNDSRWSTRWSDFGQTRRLARDWLMVYRELYGTQNHSSQAQIFRFEDLFGPESECREALIRFISRHGDRHYRILDPDVMKSPLVNQSVDPEYSWRAWSAAEAGFVDQTCGPIVQRYEYGTEPEWRELLGGESGR